MQKEIYGIHNNERIIFFTLEAAEDWLQEQYPEYCMGKDAAYEFCENMIWSDTIIRCETTHCDEAVIYSDMDDNWVKFRCCDSWFCHTDCHN